MAPTGSGIKTYSRRNTSSHALNSLLMSNLVKRKQSQRGKKRKGVIIKDLPLPDKNHHLLDDSFKPHVKTDDPFDLVCRLSDNSIVPNVEKGEVKSSDSLSLSKNLSSGCDYTKNERKRSRRNEMKNNKSLNKTEKLLESTDGLHINNIVNYRPQVSYYSSLSSLSCSQIDSSQLPHNSTVDISYDRIFNRPPDDNGVKKLLVASTPTITSSTPKRGADLVVEAYQDICSWNYHPDITPKDFDTTPIRKLTKSKHNSTNRLSSKCSVKNNSKATVHLLCSNDPLRSDDYKLRAKPKVVLCDMMDLIGISNTVTCPLNFKGFSKEDQNLAHQRVQMLNKIENGFLSSIRYHDRNQKRNSLRIKTLKKTVRTYIKRNNKSKNSLGECQVRKIINFVENDLQGTSTAQSDHNDTSNCGNKELIFQDHSYSRPEDTSCREDTSLDSAKSLWSQTSAIDNIEFLNDLLDESSSKKGEEAGLPEVTADVSSLDASSHLEKDYSEVGNTMFVDEFEDSSSEGDYRKQCKEIEKLLFADEFGSDLNGEDFSLNKVDKIRVDDEIPRKNNINGESWIENSDCENENFEPTLYHTPMHSRPVQKDDVIDLIDCAHDSINDDHSYVAKIGVDKSNCPVLQYSSQENVNDIIEDTYDEEDFAHSIQSDGEDDLQTVKTKDLSCLETSIALCSANIKKYRENMNMGVFEKSTNVSLLETSLALCDQNLSKLNQNMNDNSFTVQLSANDSTSDSESTTIESAPGPTNFSTSTPICADNVYESDSSTDESIIEIPNVSSKSSESNNSDGDFLDSSSESEIVVLDDIDPSQIQNTCIENDMLCSVVYISSDSESFEDSEESEESEDEDIINKPFETTDNQPSCFNTPPSNDDGSMESSYISENTKLDTPKEDVIELFSSDEEESTSTTIGTSNADTTSLQNSNNSVQGNITLKPGKSWRRTLTNHRRSLLYKICTKDTASDPNSSICVCAKCQNTECDTSHMSIYNRRLSVRVIPETPLLKIRDKSTLTVLESYASNSAIDLLDCTSKAVQNLDYLGDIGESIISVKANNALIHDSLHYRNPPVTAREIVLRRCGQVEPKSFSECYSDSTLRNCFKIGEGVYGEVFLFRNAGNLGSVMKVIPIEGNQMVNGERQKKYEEILSEIIIAGELSNLRETTSNNTSSFSEVQNIRCVQGCYPKRLLELWELYDEMHSSENDSPDMFKDDQLYIVLELANGGDDMEAFVFNNAVQAFSLFKQTACALAIAEAALQFEHRDLHWGNLLITHTDKDKTLNYRLNGNDFLIPTCGIQVSIIDFTLSRITFDGVCIFNDLSLDPDLFTANGDYQFEVYKLMQKQNRNEWQHFEPYSNVLWLHYILDKIIHLLHYKYAKTRIHRDTLKQLQIMKDRMLSFDSAVNFVNDVFLS